MLKRFTTHTLMALAEASLVALLVVGLIAGTAFAGKGGGGKGGGGGGGASVSWRMVVDTNGNGAPNHAEVITFAFSTSADRPIISLTCTQGGATVYGDSRPMYWPNIWDDPGNFTLSSLSWTGGDAMCTAALKAQVRKKVTTLGTQTFAVGG
jgi:hypothetical protein